MLTVQNVSFAWGPQEVLRGASLFVGRGEKVGLAGVNGAGKSTLLQIAGGELRPEAGRVTRPRRVGWLPQEPDVSGAAAPDTPAIEVVLASSPTAPLAARLAQAERALSAATDADLTNAVETYSRLEEEFRDAGGYAAQSDAAAMLAGLGLPANLADQPVRALSAGQRTRLEMARVLASGADLLLLDEPTNHLDASAARWLMEFLARTEASVLIVSHDLRLLDHAISRVYELDGRSRALTEFKGTYSQYLAWRQTRRAALETTHARQQRTIERLQATTNRLRVHASKSTKLARRVKVIDRRLDRMRAEVVELPLTPGEIGMRVGQAPRCGRIALDVQDIAHAYGPTPVLRSVSLTLERGQRLAVAGPNGAGKSTLLNIMAGTLTPARGAVTHGHNVAPAHFTHSLDPALASQTAYDVVRSLTSPNETAIRAFLATLLFHDDHVFRPLRTLSAGERARLAIAALMLRRRNLLLLDEPNSNLDQTTQAWLTEALRSYAAALVVVSHDVDFVAGLSPDLVLLMPEEHLEPFEERHLERIALV